LADQTLTLLNRTTIRYRSLKVPCCRICNNVHLSQLENRVKRLLFEQTVEEARVHLDQIFIWVTKILLAIVYAERLLPFSRRHPSGKPILPRELWDSFQMTHFFIQSLTIPMRFTYFGAERIPGSIFLFDLKTSENRRECFNFRDDVTTLSVFMRLGSRGIVAVADGGEFGLPLPFGIGFGVGFAVVRPGPEMGNRTGRAVARPGSIAA
jgi:hypothetical protein